MPGTITIPRSLFIPSQSTASKPTHDLPQSKSSTGIQTRAQRRLLSTTTTTTTTTADNFAKVLYLNQSPLPDNYVPSSFLNAMLFNHNLQTQSFSQLFLLTVPIMAKIATIAIWIAIIYSVIASYTNSIQDAFGNNGLFNINREGNRNPLITTTTAFPALVDPKRSEMLYNSPLYRLFFSNVRPVFTCPHVVTTIPIFNIDLPPNQIGYLLCDLQQYVLHGINSTTLLYACLVLFSMYCGLFFISNVLSRPTKRIKSSSHNTHTPFDKELDHNNPRQLLKSLIRVVWIGISILFLTTPLLITLTTHHFSTTLTPSLWLIITALLIITILYNDYSNLFDPIHLVYSPKAMMKMYTSQNLAENGSNLGQNGQNESTFMETNLNPSGYIHIHTHMTQDEVLERFNNPGKESSSSSSSPSWLQSKPSTLNPQIKSHSISSVTLLSGGRGVIGHNRGGNDGNNNDNHDGHNNDVSQSHSPSHPNHNTNDDDDDDDNNGDDDDDGMSGFLPVPKTFSTIFSLNIVVSILAALVIHQYVGLLLPSALPSAVSSTTTTHRDIGRYVDGIIINNHNNNNHYSNISSTATTAAVVAVVQGVSTKFGSTQQHDNIFLFIAFSVMFLSLPEVMYYYIASVHHATSRGRGTKQQKEQQEQQQSSPSRPSSPTTPIPTHIPTPSPSQYLYYLTTSTLITTAIFFLTCHSVIQPFLLSTLLFVIGVVSPLGLLMLRDVPPNAKRVIRGPWDYDDYDEVGKDNI